MIRPANYHQMGARSSGGATRFGGYALATDDPQIFNSRRPLPCWPASAGSPPSASWQLGRGLGLDRFSFVRLSAFVAARHPVLNVDHHVPAKFADDRRSVPSRHVCRPFEDQPSERRFSHVQEVFASGVKSV